MTEDKDCRKCMYFIGKLADNPRWVWTHCKQGVNNISADYAKECKYYADSYEMALNKKIEEVKKHLEWMKPRTKYCPHCGNLIKNDEEK